jgi:hypothetical protein
MGQCIKLYKHRNRNVHEWENLGWTSWLGVTFEFGISYHLNELNSKFQGQEERTSVMFGSVRSFKRSWKYFGNWWQVLINDIFLRVVGMINSLTENFKMRFSDFRSHTINLWKNVNGDRGELQLKLTEPHYDLNFAQWIQPGNCISCMLH